MHFHSAFVYRLFEHLPCESVPQISAAFHLDTVPPIRIVFLLFYYYRRWSDFS